MVKKLPVGVDNFREIREGNYYYVDKTDSILEIVKTGLYYFFARPPKYGKSVLISTLEELFSGNRALFQGLHIDKYWDWSKKYPVVKLSFNHVDIHTPKELEESFIQQISAYEGKYEIFHEAEHSAHYRLRFLLKTIEEKESVAAVVLVDDADKPMRDHLENPALAHEMRRGLVNVFNIVRNGVEHISFAMLVGSFDFTNESIFTSFDNLLDVSYFKKYSTLCGFTEKELKAVFADELKGVAIQEIRRWYQGYSWEGQVEYNPYDMIMLFARREFRPYWYEANDPDRIVSWFIDHHYDIEYLEHSVGGMSMLRSLDLEHLDSTFFMTRMGYLTIVEIETYEIGRRSFHFSFANMAIKRALIKDLFVRMVDNVEMAFVRQEMLLKAMREHDFPRVEELINEMYTSIPECWYEENGIHKNSYFFCNLFSLYFLISGIGVKDVGYSYYYRSNKLVDFDNEYFLFHLMTKEYALEHREEMNAFDYMRQDRLVKEFSDKGQPLYLIGIDLSRDENRVIGFRAERVCNR